MSKETLQKARALIEKGWCQGNYEKHGWFGNVSYCLVGALLVASEPSHVEEERSMVNRFLPGTMGIIEFNDAPGRKKSEVLEVLDKAIAAS